MGFVARAAFIALTILAVACGGEGTPAGQELEMYLFAHTGGQLEITFLKGRCCARIVVDAQTEQARAAAVAFAETLAAAIPSDGSMPSTDDELAALVPVAGSGAYADWVEDTSLYPAGPTIITTTAGDWADGSVGPFDEAGFEAVAIEHYHSKTTQIHLNLELVNLISTSAAQQAFHYRSPTAPDEPYWDRGERLH